MGELRVIETDNTIFAKKAEEVLERWLAKVRAGEIVSIGIVGATPSGAVDHEATDVNNRHTIISGLEILKWRMIERRN